MALRSQHVHDGGVVERRLRPVYDWLDNGYNKKALQEAEKVLKKSPSLQAARALKALALYRLGRAQEAEAVLDALVEEKPSDDTTLQAMTMSFRESQQLHKVCTIYENAVKIDTTNEELHSHLFMSYVRVGDFRSQQRAAMAIYKFAPKNPYYFWAVMSIVLQAKETEDTTKRNILLTLAQRMIDNFISENRMEAEQEARLYIMILELQEKWEDIIKFIESPLYGQLIPGSISQACIPYLKKLGRWKKVNILCKELLYDNLDRWDYYMPYFDSVFHLMKENSNEENIDDTAEKCHEFICQLVESMSSGRTLRGPYLARLELWKRLSVEGDPTALLGSALALCVQYLRVFASKPCAVPDLKVYLAMIPQEEREANCRDFLTCLGFDENSEPETMDDIQRHISCLTAWRLTAPRPGTTDALQLAATLRRHYLRSLEKNMIKYSTTEFCSADSYAILAAHHYFYAATEQKSSKPILEALCLLELVLLYSPANYHVKLLLVQLYHLLGNALAADSIYRRLELKHIQLVSLGWLHTARADAACVPTRALQLLADLRAFHTHHAKDSIEHMTYAYKFGTFEKVVELRAWAARLEACALCAVSARRRDLLALLAAPAPPAPPAPLHAAHTDNRDLNIIVNWEPPELQDPDLRSRTFDQDMAYLRLTDALLSSVTLCTELAENKPIEEKMQHYEQLRTCVDTFSEAMEKCTEKYCVYEKITISGPFPSRIIGFVSSPVPYRELYSITLRMIGELSMNNTDKVHELCDQVVAIILISSKLIVQEIRYGAEDNGWSMRDRLESLSNYLQSIGVLTYLLGVCYEMITPTNTKKSKKKANRSVDQMQTIKLIDNINVTLQQAIASLEELMDLWPDYDFSVDLEEELTRMNINPTAPSPVENKLKLGLDKIIEDIQNILKRKTAYLKGLILNTNT